MHSLKPDQTTILDAIKQCVIIVGDGVILHANLCFAEICKTDQSRLAGRPFFEFIISKHHKRVGKYLTAALDVDNACTTAKIEFTLHDKSGAESFVEMQAGRILFANRPAVLCTLIDITQKTRVERKLKRILDSIPEVIIAFDREHSRIESANSATEGLYGIPADQFVANIFHPFDFVLPEDSLRVQEFYAHLPEHEFARIEYRVVHANGDIRWVRDEGEVVYKEHGLGAIQQIYHFIKDITDRKNDEEDLRANEEKYRSIFETSANPIYVVTPDGRFADINHAAVLLFGYANKTQALAGNIYDHLAVEEWERLQTALGGNGCLTNYPLRIKALSGKTIEVMLSACCQKNSNSGLLESCQVILHDLSTVIARTELETYQRTLGGLSDRLNNIVQAQVMHHGLIQDYVQALKTAPDDAEKKQILDRLLTRIQDSEQSLNTLQELGEKIRTLYHAPTPPVRVSDGTDGVLFDLK